MIRTEGLVKRFGRITAVDGIDLDVRAGDVYGFLGANGSGKTTTVRMLLGLVAPTAGRIEVLGQRMPRASREVLPQVGALIESPAAYGHLSGRANLALLDASGVREPRIAGRTTPERSRRARRERVEHALAQVGMAGVDRRPVKNYSLGMRQRLGIAGALMRTPRLLILDEPTNGLDPQGIHEIRDLLVELNRAGTTVLVSSHLLAEVEQLCTRIGVLDRGRLVLQDELAVIEAPTGRVEVRTDDVPRALEVLGRRVESRDGDRLLVDVPRGEAADLNAELVAAGVPVRGLAVHRRKLEEVVLAATQGSGDRPAQFARSDRGAAPGSGSGVGPRPAGPPVEHHRLDDVRESA